MLTIFPFASWQSVPSLKNVHLLICKLVCLGLCSCWIMGGFIIPGCWPFIRYSVCKYFLPLHSLSFIWLISSSAGYSSVRCNLIHCWFCFLKFECQNWEIIARISDSLFSSRNFLDSHLWTHWEWSIVRCRLRDPVLFSCSVFPPELVEENTPFLLGSLAFLPCTWE